MGIVTQPKGGARVNKVKDVSIDELEYLIDKGLKILGILIRIEPMLPQHHHMTMKIRTSICILCSLILR